MLTRTDPASAEPPQTGLTSPTSSVASLVERGDVQALIDRLYHPEPSAPKEYAPDMAPALRALFDDLDQKIGPDGEDRNEVCAGLRSLGERAVPALIEELGTTDSEVGARVVLTLTGIGAPALPALVDVVRDGPEDRVLGAGLTIGEIRTGGVQLSPDMIRTLVTIKMSPPVGSSLTRQQAAAHALGPLHAQGIPDWAGMLKTATALGGTRPAARRPADAGGGTCKRCEGPLKSGDYTCPHCGNTRWGVIVAWAVAALVFLAAGSLWAPRIEGVVGSVVQWGGWILGGLCLLVVANETLNGLRTQKLPVPGSVAAAATGVAPGLGLNEGAMPRLDPAEAEARAWIADKERAPVCDRCNAVVAASSGTVITPDVFRQIVRQGFGPAPEAVANAVMGGLTREQFTRGWTSGLVEGSTTPWLLCQSCALQAKAFTPEGLGR